MNLLLKQSKSFIIVPRNQQGTRRLSCSFYSTIHGCGYGSGYYSASNYSVSSYNNSNTNKLPQQQKHLISQNISTNASMMNSPSYILSRNNNNINSTSSSNSTNIIKSSFFHSEAQFHQIADETLDTIQDSIDELFENDSNGIVEDDALYPEVNLSSGVLTISFGNHGTWVINKQTPNKQIWWSSPLSGPRRYEYDENKSVWVFSKSTVVKDDDHNSNCNSNIMPTLGDVLKKEIKELYKLDLDIHV